MHMDCDIIRDLLPLYEDGALSESGARAVSAHLAACPACRDYRARVEGDSVARAPRTAAPETMELRAVARKIRRRNILIAVFGAVLFVWAVLFAVDYSRARVNKPPLFAPLREEVVLDSDGASVSGYTMYYGLGYKVIQYQSEYSRSDCEIGTWFLQPGNIDSVTQAELNAIEAYLSEEMTLRYGDEKSFSSIKILLCEQTDAHTKKIYLWECTETFRASALRSGNTTAESGVSMPAAVTIRTADGQTTVTDVWRPRDGSFYAADIASEFPTCARRQLWEYDDGVQQRVLSLQNRTKALLYFVAHPQP